MGKEPKLRGPKLKYKGGKGDKRRPMFITYKQYEENWDRIFGKGAKKNEDK